MNLDELDLWPSIQRQAARVAPNWRYDEERCVSCGHCERLATESVERDEEGGQVVNARLTCDAGHEDADHGDVFMTRRDCDDYARFDTGD